MMYEGAKTFSCSRCQETFAQGKSEVTPELNDDEPTTAHLLRWKIEMMSCF